MAGGVVGIRVWIRQAWHNGLRPKSRRLRAGALRRLGVLPPPTAPPTAPSPEQIGSAPVGTTDALRPESAFETNLQTDAETAEVWHRALLATRGDLHPEPILETPLRPDPETLSVWHDLLRGRPEDTDPSGEEGRRRKA